MIKMKRKIFSILLCIVLVSGIIPIEVSAEEVNSGKAIQFGTGGISGYSDTDSYDYIYYGIWDSMPIKWRVLDDKTNTGDEGMFLLSDALLVCYDADGSEGIKFGENSNVWNGSTSQKWFKDTFAPNSFSTSELNAIIKTSKTDTFYEFYNVGGVTTTFYYYESVLDNDQFFYLSVEEADTKAYGFVEKDNDNGNGARIAYYKEGGEKVASYWFLRSPNNNYLETLVQPKGSILTYQPGNRLFPRPAMNLDSSQILFTSAASDGKLSNSTGENALKAVENYNDSDWKLTLHDTNRDNFSANVGGKTSVSVPEGGSVEITYSGAQTSGKDNEYVSALLCDNNDNILYYGNIAQNSAQGSAKVNLPTNLAAGSYTLKVFSEQCNEDQKTDYASKFQDISLTVLQREATPNASFTASGEDSGTLSDVDTSMKYSVDGGNSWIEITDTTTEITGVTAENGVKVYKTGDGTQTLDSEEQTIEITQAGEPSGVKGISCATKSKNDGKLTGVNSAMEYRQKDAAAWTEITGDMVTGLAAGTYEVRMKANGQVLASPFVTVEINKHICTAEGGWNADENEHWKLCACGEKLDIGAHSGGDISSEGEAICEICGEVYKASDVVSFPISAPTSSSTEENAQGHKSSDKSSSPDTGDENLAIYWGILLLASGIVLTGTVVFRRKRREKSFI